MQSGLTGNPINSVARTQNEQEAGSEKADLHDPRLAENGYRQQRPLPRLSGHSARYTNIPIAGVPAIETCPRGPACRETVAETGSNAWRSEEHTSELQSLMRLSYAVFCLTKKTHIHLLHHYQS